MVRIRQYGPGQYRFPDIQVNEDTLEDVLLFVGILSGRGYRHRRLAVREAWANQCQRPGVSVCRFMLSEDEVTPQASIPLLRSEATLACCWVWVCEKEPAMLVAASQQLEEL